MSACLNAVVRAVFHVPQRVQISGIGELVDVDDALGAGSHEMPANGGSDEAGAPCNENPHSLLLRFAGIEKVGIGQKWSCLILRRKLKAARVNWPLDSDPWVVEADRPVVARQSSIP